MCNYSEGVMFVSSALMLVVTFGLRGSQAVPTPGVTTFEELFSAPLGNESYAHAACDDEQLRSLTQQVELLQSSTDNLHVKLDTYNLRLSHIKELLEQRLPSVGNDQSMPPIDVRTGVEAALNSKPALPKTCDEAKAQAGAAADDGIYQLYLPGFELKPFYVYCLRDPLGGAAWTVVQRRQDGSTQFYRNWQDYESGFGNVYNEFFIGLARLHALTHSQLNELWIELKDFENGTRYARYDGFAVGDAAEQYALQVLGAYSGNAGDSLRQHEGQKFSTKDRGISSRDGNCAAESTGAWWYNDRHESNLNGQYLPKGNIDKEHGQGIYWMTWHGRQYSLKFVHMAIRPLALAV